MPTPFLLVGDGPNEPSGLGRILRDLGALICNEQLDVDLVSAGGPPLPVWKLWRHVPMGEVERAGDWGKSFIEALWQDLWGRRPGILWVIWDPSRLAAFLKADIPAQLWSYPAIDGDNYAGTVGGPAGEALNRADRVLAYGQWASTVVRTLRPRVPFLPHGLTLATYAPASEQERDWADEQLGPHVRRGDFVVGCVATNQPRKDLGLYFQTLRTLADREYHHVYGWLHTDVMVKAWAIAQLVEDCGLAKRVTVTLGTYTDRQLALLYQRCAVTVAPGLGEGFGYPIVESLANGVPVVHGGFGGGKELVPKREWRFPVREIRLDGIYAVRRPVFRADDVANAIDRVWRWRDTIGPAAAEAYCRGAVAHLDWDALWPRWRGWIREGL